MFCKIRAFRRLCLLVFGFLVWTPLYRLLLWTAPETAFKLMRLFYGYCFKVLGIRLDIKGAPVKTSPTLFVANHASYTDVLILGFLVPATFVAKEEIARWPIIGWIAKTEGAIFIKRQRHVVHHYLENFQKHLSSGKSLVLFPEGTSSDACQVLPFYNSFFECFQVCGTQKDFLIQPVSIHYKALDGFPMGRFLKKLYGWTGGLNFWEHLWKIAQLTHVTVKITFSKPLSPRDFNSRKELAAAAWSQVNQGFFNHD